MHQDATVTVTPIAACTAPTDSATTAAAAAEMSFHFCCRSHIGIDVFHLRNHMSIFLLIYRRRINLYLHPRFYLLGIGQWDITDHQIVPTVIFKFWASASVSPSSTRISVTNPSAGE